ncbi:hypothetical protein LCGC14_1904520 [marine sediment metagenome]|uniref:Uncharacterized protein n=1 Tax=marine sediment metagenome TaxID=412755 RepID=A0A0F9FVX4_9ZZZZ
MTIEQKIQALITELGLSRKEAVEMLVDMGEIDER